MKTTRASLAVLAGVMFLALCTGPSAAQSISFEFPDFSDLSTFTLNGTAAAIENPITVNERPVLRLTETLGQTGSAFVTDSIPLMDAQGFRGSFSTFFSFLMLDPCCWGDVDGAGADGLVFVVQTVSDTVGGGGGGIGYADIPRSLGVEFDTYDNGAPDRNSGNHVGINTNGNITSHVVAPVGTRLNNGEVWYAWIDYDGAGALLEVRLSEQSDRPEEPLLTYSVDLAGVLESPYAFVGFTAGTGGGGETHDIASWAFKNAFEPISGVDAEREGLDHPTSFSLQGNYPNPFNPTTAITFETSKPSAVTLKVFDSAGRHIRTLVDRAVGAGTHREIWDGSDARGRLVESGVYLAVLRVGDRLETTKMTLLK